MFLCSFLIHTCRKDLGAYLFSTACMKRGADCLFLEFLIALIALFCIFPILLALVLDMVDSVPMQ